MTAAGKWRRFFITQDMLHPTDGLDCKGNISNDNIERGLAWITAHFAEVRNAYTWYGIQRIGAASGRKYLGPNNWYAIGADKLVKSQAPNGSWTGIGPGMSDPLPCIPRSRAACFSPRAGRG